MRISRQRVFTQTLAVEYTNYNFKKMKKLLAIVAIVVGLLIAFGVLGKGILRYDNDEVAQLPASAASSTSIATAPGNESDLPWKLLIPKLEVDADVQRLGVTSKGLMAAPANFTDVSWYKLGTIPGNRGSAVMAGHEDNAISLDGVFKHLDDLQVGDDVYVVEESGEKLHFKVVEKKVYPYNLSGSELERVFNAKDKARLNLITCTGEWVQAIKTNNKRLVVFTELAK